MPEGRIITSEGVEYKCYNLEEYKKIAHLNVSYNDIWDIVIDLERLNFSLSVEIDLWKERQKIWEEKTKFQQERADMLSKMFDDEHNLRLKLQKQYKAFRWIPWTLVIAESVLLGGLGVFYSVSK